MNILHLVFPFFQYHFIIIFLVFNKQREKGLEEGSTINTTLLKEGGSVL